MEYKEIKKLLTFQGTRVRYRKQFQGKLDAEDVGILRLLQKLELESRPKIVNISFEAFWGLYNLKIGKQKSEKLWVKLTDEERLECMRKIPAYLRSLKETGLLQKNPETYLRNKSWEDELRTAPKEDVKPQRQTDWI